MPSQGEFIADRTIYIDAEGKVVDAKDPKKLTKIANAGTRVSEADVQKYGLRKPEPKPAVPEKVTKPAKEKKSEG